MKLSEAANCIPVNDRGRISECRDTTSELEWIKMLMNELNIHVSLPMQVWCDNMGAITLTSNPTHHIKAKHVGMNYRFVREN